MSAEPEINEPGFIPKEEYVNIIKQTQIISTDLIIFNQLGQVLLGYRNNEPAKNTWFVPGGQGPNQRAHPRCCATCHKTRIRR